jgi:hypothetical protein
MNELVGSGTTVAWIHIDTHIMTVGLIFRSHVIWLFVCCCRALTLDVTCGLDFQITTPTTYDCQDKDKRDGRERERERDAKERDTHARERDTRRARWRLKRENKQRLLGRNSYTFCAGMGADFPNLLHKQHSWSFYPIPLRVAQQIWDFTTVQIPHPLPPSPAFLFFLFLFISGFSFLFLFYLSTSLAP